MPHDFSGNLEAPACLKIPEAGKDGPSNWKDAVDKSLAIDRNKGFIVKPVPDNDNYDFFAEINVNNSELWDVLEELMKKSGDELVLMFTPDEQDEEALWQSAPTKKSEMMSFIKGHKREFIEDCFLAYGFGFQTGAYLEIYVTRFKYLKI
jgi:hypothetical protein